MIKNIVIFLKGYEDPGFDDELEDDAYALLCLIESFGMKPPLCNNFDFSNGENAAYIENYKWEPEDD